MRPMPRSQVRSDPDQGLLRLWRRYSAVSELRNGLRRRPQFGAGYFNPDRLVTLDGLPDYSNADGAAIRAERRTVCGRSF